MRSPSPSNAPRLLRMLGLAPALALALLAPAWLAAPAMAQAQAAAAADPADTDAEVRRIDSAGGRITLAHAEIRNLDMPPMTMAFEVRDKAWLEGLKPGDKVRFRAVKEGSRYVLTALQPVR